MNPALKKRCSEIQACFARASSDDVLARYRIGQLLLDTRKKEQAYGTNAVGQLSVALRRPVSTLYRYASAAECWSGKEMAALAEQLNSFGEPLSWSHWVALAQVRSPEVRERLRLRALAEGLSVRELAEAVRALHPSVAPGGDDIADAVDEVARSCERWSGQALAAAEAIARRVKTSEPTNPELLGQITKAVRAHEAVREQSEEALRVLRAAMETLGGGGGRARAPARRDAADRPRLIAGMRP